mmetsp:Transcript_27661/g.31735  ORF Transcript_27661/g.31735 Transcript_27661/m.31735 type:complete len:229 (+) Transcript_27661:911-1597(+)
MLRVGFIFVGRAARRGGFPGVHRTIPNVREFVRTNIGWQLPPFLTLVTLDPFHIILVLIIGTCLVAAPVGGTASLSTRFFGVDRSTSSSITSSSSSSIRCLGLFGSKFLVLFAFLSFLLAFFVGTSIRSRIRGMWWLLFFGRRNGTRSLLLRLILLGLCCRFLLFLRFGILCFMIFRLRFLRLGFLGLTKRLDGLLRSWTSSIAESSSTRRKLVFFTLLRRRRRRRQC